MTRVTCYIRPHRLESVKSAIAALGISGMSVSDVRGTGSSPEQSQWFGGTETLIALPVRAKVEVVVGDELAEPMVQAILANAHTGEPGDGKIFLERIGDAVRVRTNERGEMAI